MAELTSLTAETFDAAVAANQPVMVDFWAPWCGPCRMVGPIMEQLHEEFTGKASICKVNVDDEQALAERFSVMSIPTVLVFKNGEMVEKSIGAKPKQAFAELINKHL